MNFITVVGNVAADGEIRFAGNGNPVLNFRVGSTTGYGDKKQTLWFGCSLWGKRSEALAPYVTKGAKVTLVGQMSQREYNDKLYLEINVNEIALQGDKGESKPKADGFRKPDNAKSQDFADDDIPF